MKVVRIATAVALALVLAGSAFAQSKGRLRLSGKVLNEAGQPVEDAEVRAAKKGEAQPQVFSAKTNNKGEWTIRDIAAGEWVIEAAKEGVGVAETTETLTDADRNKTVTLTIAPRVDPNEEIQARHKEAVALAQAGKNAEARKILEDLLVKYPTLHQLHPGIAELYVREGNAAKALEHVKLAVEKEPENADWLMMQAELMMEAGDHKGADEVLAKVDMTKVRDPRAFMNSAINKINSGDKAQAEAAAESVTKLIAQFPNEPMLYYLRARAHITATRLAEAKTDLEKFVEIAPPTSPQLADAKKLLEQLGKK